MRFAFKASNNQAEYEALIVGMLLAKEMGAQSLLAKSDSQLVTGQVTGGYQAKDPQMATYLRYVEVLKRAFAAVPSRTRALTKSRSKSTPGVKVNTRRCLGEETLSASVVKKRRRQGKVSPW